MDTLIRLVVVAALAPFWWPLAKTILDEFRALLRGSGPISRNTFERGAPLRDREDDHLTSESHRGPRVGARGFDAERGRRLGGARGFRPGGEGIVGSQRRRRGA